MGQAGAGQVKMRGIGMADGQVEGGAGEVDGFAKATTGDFRSKTIAGLDRGTGKFVDRRDVAQGTGLGALADDGAYALYGGKVHGEAHLFLL